MPVESPVKLSYPVARFVAGTSRHEIVGIVTEVGSDASGWKVGDRAGIGCFVRTCRECKQCHRSTDQYCPKMVR